jgi:crotonobetainyl-CoA:carnitine CoA-transferase CaiB-like acyl-CoA transferase
MARTSRPVFRAALADLEQQCGLGGLLDAARFGAEQLALPSRFMTAEGAAAALAAGAAVAARLAAARGAPAGVVDTASRHVEASLLSFAHLRFLDPSHAPPARQAPEERTAAAGFHRTADARWIYLHPGFPHNTRGLLALLGVPDDRDAVRAAVAGRRGGELEEAIGAAGLCGAMARSPEEWEASLPGRLLAARPVVDVVQLNDTAPEPLPPQAVPRPLQGVRVLDLTRVLAGPTCGRTLASYGAEVLRVAAPALPFVPLFVADTGFGKRSAHLDLTGPDDAQRLRRLIRDADVFTQGYRTGAMDRLGFGVTDVVQLRPGIVYVSINCYGHEGPWRARPGWEQLAQTVTGMAHRHGADTGAEGPVLLPAAVTDYTTGYLAAFGVLAALERRARVGGSYWVRVSLARTGMWVQSLGRRRSATAKPMTAAEIAALQDEADTAWGRVRHLRPAVTLSTGRVGWDLPPAPLGSHPPSFT